MTVAHLAIPNDDILARCSEPATVSVSTTFYRDAVIAGVEEAAFDQHVGARLGIAPIIVGAVGIDRQSANRHVTREDGMHFPHRRVDDLHPLDEDIPATVRLNERRPEIV